MKKVCVTMMALLPVVLFCQDKISGKVLSEKHQPLQGASVFIPNTTTGTQTNAKGEFTLNRIPRGKTRLAISYIGYKTATVMVIPANDNPYLIILSPDIHELEGVTVNSYDENGWELWGTQFTSAFIGTSAYAAKCVLKNKEAVNFIFRASTKTLHAYASEPLIIENNALGYRINVTLADFAYNMENKNVDYQVYSFFEEMQGSEKDMLKWKSNRLRVYELSLMHFMRALYLGNAAAEGFEILRLQKRKNIEKQRVQEIYKQQFIHIKDSVGSEQLKESTVNKKIERPFNKDSLKYYRKILEQDDGTKKLHDRPVDEKSITRLTGDSTVMLHFKDYLIVTYKKKPEPEEYYNYRKAVTAPGEFEYDTGYVPGVTWPVTELVLQQDIPVEISASGYFTNIDLFINGFWGWWEKMATKLPYGYQP